MKSKLLAIACLGLSLVSHSQSKSIGRLITMDPHFNALIPSGAKIEILADSFAWTEGPVWVKDSSFLLFSDIPNNTIFKWKDGTGLSVFLKPSGYTGRLPYSAEPGSNGLIINKNGQLVACEHGDRRISIMPLNLGGKRTLTDNFQGKRYNSPNDIVQRSEGDYYFTDPAYGLPNRDNDTLRETTVMGVYHLSVDGKVSLLLDEKYPNGIVFSPDEKILYVGHSNPDRPVIDSYPVNADGSLGAGKVFFDCSTLKAQGITGAPDGMKVDKEGNLFISGLQGFLVISPTGKLLGRIAIDGRTSNCAWGNDGSTLYMTANNILCRIKTLTKGIGF